MQTNRREPSNQHIITALGHVELYMNGECHKYIEKNATTNFWINQEIQALKELGDHIGDKEAGDHTIIIQKAFLKKDGWTLLSEINIEELNPASRKTMLKAILEQISIIEKKGIIHNDLSKKNILFNIKTKKAKLIDFGMAIFLNQLDNRTSKFITPPFFPAPKNQIEKIKNLEEDWIKIDYAVNQRIDLRTALFLLNYSTTSLTKNSTATTALTELESLNKATIYTDVICLFLIALNIQKYKMHCAFLLTYAIIATTQDWLKIQELNNPARPNEFPSYSLANNPIRRESKSNSNNEDMKTNFTAIF